MHIWVNYFVTRPMLCMAPVGFQLDFLLSFKEQRLPRKRDYRGRLSLGE